MVFIQKWHNHIYFKVIEVTSDQHTDQLKKKKLTPAYILNMVFFLFKKKAKQTNLKHLWSCDKFEAFTFIFWFTKNVCFEL